MKTILIALVTATILCGFQFRQAFGTAAASPGPAQRVDPARLMANLEALPKQRAALGDIEHQRGLATTEKLLVAQLQAMGHEPVLHAISWNLHQQEAQEVEPAHLGQPRRPLPETTRELATRTWHNIIVDLPGTDSPEQLLIIGAHFDAVPGSPGADDNGSGTAALLELAHVLKDVPMKRTVRLIFFNLEEIGLRGSADYVRDHHERFQSGKEQVIGMVSLEMLGYFSDEEGSQRSPVPAIPDVFDPPTVGNFIAIATIQQYQAFSQLLGREMSRVAPTLKVLNADFFPVAPPDLLRSDHAPFMKAGVPAVMLTDTAEYRNPHYHKASDTVDTLDHERYTLVVRAVAGAVHAIATVVD
jgi:hypothetical protein